jgi:hypothetical protein
VKEKREHKSSTISTLTHEFEKNLEEKKYGGIDRKEKDGKCGKEQSKEAVSWRRIFRFQ